MTPYMGWNLSLWDMINSVRLTMYMFDAPKTNHYRWIIYLFLFYFIDKENNIKQEEETPN